MTVFVVTEKALMVPKMDSPWLTGAVFPIPDFSGVKLLAARWRVLFSRKSTNPKSPCPFWK